MLKKSVQRALRFTQAFFVAQTLKLALFFLLPNDKCHFHILFPIPFLYFHTPSPPIPLVLNSPSSATPLSSQPPHTLRDTPYSATVSQPKATHHPPPSILLIYFQYRYILLYTSYKLSMSLYISLLSSYLIKMKRMSLIIHGK